MIITGISDLHGYQPELPKGDLLICAGDCTARDTVAEWFKFFAWFEKQDYLKKILVAGNHDGCLEQSISSQEAEDMRLRQDWGFDYLCDSGTEFLGYKIWGSPWTPPFCNWHFMLPPVEIAKKWDLIPDDTDILITHGPPLGILDDNEGNLRCGCPTLRARVDIIQPKIHIFGHIHESFGYTLLKHAGPNTDCYNVSIMDENYRPVNPITRIVI